MANTFTSVNTEFLGTAVIDAYVAALSPLRAFTISATNATAYRGEKVRVLSVGTGSAALDYTDTYSMQHSEASGIDVTLDKHKFVSLELKDSEWRDSSLLEVERFARAKGYALALSVMTDVMSFVSSSFQAEKRTVAKSNAFSASAIVDLSSYADSLNWPEQDRSLVINPSQHSYLRKDTALQSAMAFGSPEIIRKGQVPSLDTFSSIYKTSVVPTTTVGYAAVPNAIVFASRVVGPQEPNSYSDVKVITDSETGLSITQLVWHNPDAGARRIAWTVEYGYNIGNSKGLFLLV